MPDVVQTFVQNNDVRLSLERRGRGSRHVLFAHGWISSRRMWYDVADRLDPQGYTSHLLDFRGCGRSDRPEAGHDLEGYASDLRVALGSIDAPVTLLGHSMGGKLAQYVAAERPANLERLILVAPGSARGLRPSPRRRAAAIAAFGSRRKIEVFQRAAMVAALPDETMERIVDDALIAQREHWLGWYDRGREAAFPERLAEIGVPTLAIAGDGDPLVPLPQIKRDVAGAIPGCLLVVLRHTGHNVPVERPDEVAAAVERFGQV
jgi:pimeloyl-ACP methyl ester carboxylesterase